MKTLNFYGENVDTLRGSIGEKIKAHRKVTGLSQAELAELIGCEAPLISRYERGVTLPSIEQLIRLATVFNVIPGELLPDGQDELRTRLIALRLELTKKIVQIDSPASLEEILQLTEIILSRDNS